MRWRRRIARCRRVRAESDGEGGAGSCRKNNNLLERPNLALVIELVVERALDADVHDCGRRSWHRASCVSTLIRDEPVVVLLDTQRSCSRCAVKRGGRV